MKKPVVNQAERICPECMGTGFTRADHSTRPGVKIYQQCKECKGKGRVAAEAASFQLSRMMKFKTVGMNYADLRKDCLEAVRQWPGCETISGIRIIRSNRRSGFSVRITLYGEADQSIADRAMIYVEREKRRRFHLVE